MWQEEAALREANGLSFSSLQRALADQELLANKSWRLSPQPWVLSTDQIAQMAAIGQAIVEFFTAVEELYRKSRQGNPILRNKPPLVTPWVADYLDRGKPARLLAHALQAAVRGKMPSIIRPDLLLTEQGFALTEIDPCPGGVGLTAYLNRLYATAAGETLIGRDDLMVANFYSTLAALTTAERPVVAIVVSEEAATYRPEFRWLAEQCQLLGQPVYTVTPEQLQVLPEHQGLAIRHQGQWQRVAIIYRFFELFDLANVAQAQAMITAVEQAQVVVTPPMRPFQEEKLTLALFRHHRLVDFWPEQLSPQAYRTLDAIIPGSWVIDDCPLPPGALLDAPRVAGRPITDWRELGQGSQRERRLIIKASGFHEEAWGARSVTLGSDVAKEAWQQALRHALAVAPQRLYIVQEYCKPRSYSHPVYNDQGLPVPMRGRVRLCPYFYIRQRQAQLVGILATFCAADKKIIHGMSDAVLLPVVAEA